MPKSRHRSLVDYSQREGSLKESHPNIIIFTNEKAQEHPIPELFKVKK